jgi:hypothetical protein
MSNDKPSTQLGPLSGPQSILRAAALFARERDLRALVACAVVQGLAGSFVMPYMSLFGTREVGMSVPAFGAFMTLTVLANILIGNVLARRSDQMTSRRPVLLLGSAAGALGYLGYAFVRDAWSLSAPSSSVSLPSPSPSCSPRPAKRSAARRSSPAKRRST